MRRGTENRTDRAIDLYHVQLEDYARALERMTGKRVKEKIIYIVYICRKRYCCRRNKNLLL